MSERIGLIGIGLVGTALAENLLKAGYGVVGYDIEPGKCRQLEAMGGKAAGNARDVGEQVARVFLSLMTTGIVREVVEGPDGLLEAETPPRYILDTTTGDPQETAALADRLKERGVRLLDAPISGSSQQIRTREAVFMVGGELEAYQACEDLFRAAADRSFHLGPSGCGSKAKLASNLIIGINRLALAEGLVFAERLGLDLPAFLRLLKQTPAYSCAMDVKGEKMLEADFAPQSRIAQHNKDLEIILRYAEKFGQPLPLARLHKDVLEACIETGDGELDTCVVIQQIRRLAVAAAGGKPDRETPELAGK